MKNNTIHFIGTITTEQPYASATPATAKLAKRNGPMPVTSMVKGGHPVMVVLSNTIKGGLRRAAAEIAFLYQQQKAGHDKPLTRDEHKQNRIGGVKQKGASDRISPDDIARINEKHPLIALFGAGEPFIKGKLMIETAYCSHNNHIMIDGIRTDDHLRDPALLSQLDEESIQQFFAETTDISKASTIKKERDQLMRDRMRTDDPKERTSLDKKMAKLDENLTKLDAGNSTQLPLPGYCAIPAGEHLEHTIRLRQDDDEMVQLGFLLCTLDYFSYKPLLGGKIANGCGVISMEYEVTRTGYNQERETLGAVKILPYGGVEIEGEYLNTAIAAYKTAHDSHTFDFGLIK